MAMIDETSALDRGTNVSQRHKFGVITAAEIAKMTGREVIDAIVAGTLPQAPMAEVLGFRLTEAGDGVVVFEGEPRPAFCNPLGTVHGGLALTLIDSAAGCAAHTLLDRGVLYTTIETKVNFARAILPDTGMLRTEGRVVTRGRQIITAEARIIDTTGRILAHGSSTLFVLGPARASGA